MTREIEGDHFHHGSRKYGEVNCVEICRMAAKAFSGRDWHELTLQEKRLVRTLEDAKYIGVNRPSTGFVGSSL